MMKRHLYKRVWWFILPALLLLAGPAAAAQFSALMMVKDGDKTLPAKIFVQDGKMRQEFNDEEGQTVTIVRPDRKVVWIIIPRKRAYLEMPLKRQLPGQFIQIPPDAVTKRLVGKETVNGYETEKYEVGVRVGGGLEKQTVWLATKLGTPVKMVSIERRFSLEYKSIKEAPQPERLFNLPPGYQKLKSPAGFTSGE
jgi:outer membrane lipoprotein-sorting protein